MSKFKLPVALMATCAALLALFVVPAIASASPKLERKAGGLVATGTGLKGASSNLVFTGTGPAGELKCSKSEVGGTLKTNSGMDIEGEITTATFTGTKNPGGTACETTIVVGGKKFTASITTNNSATTPWCLKSTALGVWSLGGGACGGAAGKIKFTATLFESEVTNRGTCIYETKAASTPIQGTYVSSHSPLELAITSADAEFEKVGGTFVACPADGSLSGTFTVTATTGEAELKVT